MFRFIRHTIDRFVIQDTSFKFLYDRDETGEVVSLDCETTGFDPWIDDVISVAAIKIKDNRILTHQSFNALVKPEAEMRPEAMKVHRLLQRDVASAKPMAEVLPDLLRFIGSRPIMGYWIDFDMSMLDKYVLHHLGVRLPNERVEVSKLYYDRKYGDAPQGTQLDLRFDVIRKDLKLPPINQHDAHEDALLAAKMYVILKDMKARGARIPRTAGIGGVSTGAAPRPMHGF
jgi:DNA polymerase-3 subunit epsilon